MNKPKINILLVEDDPDHANLILDIFDTEDVESKVVLMKNGQEVIDYLQETDSPACQTTSLNGRAGQTPLGRVHDVQPIVADVNRNHFRIDLIILDLNLPKIHGMDVLKSLKGNANYSLIPVVVLSTSSDQNTILEVYKNGANGYVTKPMSYDEFVDKIKMLRRYWSDTNTLPLQI